MMSKYISFQNRIRTIKKPIILGINLIGFQTKQLKTIACLFFENVTKIEVLKQDYKRRKND